MDVGAVANETKRVQFTIAGQTGWVDYRPNYYTLAFNTKLEAAQREGNLAAMAELLTHLYVDWDLVRDGEKIPVTEEGIASLPLLVLNWIDDALMQDMEIPSDDEKKGSSVPTASLPGGSTPASLSSPNGLQSSPTSVPQPVSSAPASTP